VVKSGALWGIVVYWAMDSQQNEVPENNDIAPIYYSSLYKHGVDEKRRVQIPAKWRAQDEATFTLIVWKKGQQPACLLALPPVQMKALADKLAGMSMSDPKAETLRRWLGAKSDQVTSDKAGRICIPEMMAKEAGIEKEAVLVGMIDRFQIWAPQRYEGASVIDDALSDEAMNLI
jgi:MraZ protein